MPAFEDLSSCLNHALTKTSQKVVWNETMTKSFNKIISNICHHTLLTIPTCDDKFVLSCDASSYEVGSALSVVRCDLELPVAFYSRQLLSRETRYSATELEALALLCSVKHFAFYLFGKSFTVTMDHKALEHLFDSSMLNNRLWRWQMQLQDYDFNIVYRPGKDNEIADSLSRQGWEN